MKKEDLNIVLYIKKLYLKIPNKIFNKTNVPKKRKQTKTNA